MGPSTYDKYKKIHSSFKVHNFIKQKLVGECSTVIIVECCNYNTLGWHGCRICAVK